MSVVFLVIFGLSTVAHIWQSFTRTAPRFMILMAVGGGGDSSISIDKYYPVAD